MGNIPHSECRKCGKPIYWHRSRTNKPYPCDSPSDRRAFHQCSEAQQPAHDRVNQAVTDNVRSEPIDFEPSLEERVSHLEKTVNNLIRTVQAVQARQPITAEDVGF